MKPHTVDDATLKASLEEWALWESLPGTARLEIILTCYDREAWAREDILQVLAAFRHDPIQWHRIDIRGRTLGVNLRKLEEAVDRLVQAGTVPTTTGTRPDGAAAADSPRLQTIRATELYAKDLPPLDYIIPGILPVGATLFTGRGKDGKSLLAWNLCLAVATGGTALGAYDVPPGEVLYMALEDGERRAKQRLKAQMAAMGAEEPPDHLELVLWDAPRLGEGLEDGLTRWIDEHPAARLVVIDILEKVRPRRTRQGSVYADDYAALTPLQRLAQDRNVAILIVHHSNKTKPEDFRDTASGSMGLIGACDTFWSVHRLAGDDQALLRIIGRDVEAHELALRFAEGFWTVLGEADPGRLSPASQEVLAMLAQLSRPCTPAELASRLGAPRETIKRRLLRMAARGEVRQRGDGHYYVPDARNGMIPAVPTVPGVPGVVPGVPEVAAMRPNQYPCWD